MRNYVKYFSIIFSIFLLFTACDLDELPPPEIAQSNITLPNRRLTEWERDEWIAEYRSFGGPTVTELEVIRLINNVRRTENLSFVVRDDTLMMAARFFAQQARDLRGLYTGTHNFEIGRASCRERV